MATADTLLRRPRGTRTYHHIPTLKQLLPLTEGWPGLVYAQVALHNIRHVQNDEVREWRQVGDVDVYTIKGPDGDVDVMLIRSGTPVPGQQPGAGRRICWIDEELPELTGLAADPKWLACFDPGRSGAAVGPPEPMDQPQPHGHEDDIPLSQVRVPDRVPDGLPVEPAPDPPAKPPKGAKEATT